MTPDTSKDPLSRRNRLWLAAAMFVASFIGLLLFVFNHREHDHAAESAALQAKDSSSAGHNAVGAVATLHVAQPQAKAQPAKAAASLPAAPPVGALLEDSYPLLKQLADAGDPHAACRLSFELDRCIRVKNFELAASMTEANLAKMDAKTAGYESIVAIAKSARSDADFAKRICTGFVVRDPDEAWKYSLQAALTGPPSIKVRYVTTFTAALDVANPAATAEGWVAYRQNAPALLQQAIDAGSPEAFQHAFFRHVTPDTRWRILPRDFVAALSYYMALESVAAPAYKSVLEHEIAAFAASPRVTESDMARARSAADVLEKKLVGVAPGSVDFSRNVFPNDKNGNQCELTR